MKATFQTTLAFALALAGATFLSRPSDAAVFREDFTQDPASHGWNVRGDAAAFAWNTTTGRLAVTWDSSRPSGFFWHPLETVVARTDDCRFAFTVGLDHVEVAPGPGTFQIAIGFLGRTQAFATNSFRGAGVNPTWGARNLLEFDYFPASDLITPTFSTVAVDATNVRWAFIDLFPYELVPGIAHRVECVFTHADQTLRLKVSRNGLLLAEGSTRLDNRFTDYRLDAFSITSYSGEHQPAGYGGQILVRGWVDDLEFEVPDPPSARLEVHRVPSGIQFATPVVPDWRGRIERSSDWVTWTPLDLEPLTSDATWTFADPSPPIAGAGYRLRLERP